MSKDIYELAELILSDECTTLNAYLYYYGNDPDALIKIPVNYEDLANWILLNKEFLLSVLKDWNNEISALKVKIIKLRYL